jgi:hypothetical protein
MMTSFVSLAIFQLAPLKARGIPLPPCLPGISTLFSPFNAAQGPGVERGNLCTTIIVTHVSTFPAG